MPDTLPWLLTYTLAPVAAIVLGGCAAVARPQGKPLISAFEHFAAGVVFSAVAIELMPRLHEIDQPLPMVVGFVAGVMAMMASRRWFEAAGTLVPTAVDLFIDGLLIAIGLAAGGLRRHAAARRPHHRGRSRSGWRARPPWSGRVRAR